MNLGPYTLIVLLFAPMHCAANRREPAMQYSYRANQPTQWTRTELPESAAGPASDFTVVLGGSNGYFINHIAVDSLGNSYAAGCRQVRIGPEPSDLSCSAFVAMLDATGS